MKLTNLLLGLLALTALTACQQDAPSPSQQTTPAKAYLSSQNTGEKITLDLSAFANPVDLNKAEAETMKSLDFNYTPSTGKLQLTLDQTKDSYRVLLILRPVGGSQMTYAIQEWKHLKNQRKLYIHEVQVTLPAGLSYNSYSWEAMLFLLPDALTESQLQSQGYKLPYNSTIATGAPIDMGQSRTFQLNIPYATDWTPLTKRQHAVDGDELSSHSFKFKPLGTVVTYKVTNSMDQAISLTGLKVVSNAVVSNAKLDLSATSLASTTAQSAGARFSDFGNVYEDRTFNYTLPVTNLAKNQTASTGLVVWYPTTGAVSRTTFDYNDGTPVTDLTGRIRYPEYFRSQDPEAAARYATTHVYAVGATKGGSTITKPNLDLVPIMGTDVQLASGKSYVMPCELYEQPHLQLGYFAKTPLKVVVNASGVSAFALAEEAGLNNNNVPLLGLRDELVNYVHINDPSNPWMSPITINGMQYMLPNNALIRATGLLSTNLLFFPNKAYGLSAGMASVADKRGVWDRDMSFIDEQGQLQAPVPSMIIAYSDVTAHVGTCLMFRSAELATNVGHPVRNVNQAVYRITANRDPSSTEELVSSFDVSAVYLGKYYVGDVAPFLSASNWDSSSSSNILANRVRRRFYVGGKYVAVRSGSSVTYPKNRYAAGQLGSYWSLDKVQFLPYGDGYYQAAPVIGSWGFYGDDHSTYQNIWDNWSYRIAHPYSTTYQGD